MERRPLVFLDDATLAELPAGDTLPVTVDAASVVNTPAGNIAAVTVQDALNELDAEKAPLSHTHSASEIGAIDCGVF